MKRMAPLLLILVLVLAPAAWGYDITLIPSSETSSITSYATVYHLGTFTQNSPSSVTPVTGPDIFNGKHALQQTNDLPTPPDSSAVSDWVAKVYNPIVTWDPDGAGKTTSIKLEVNVSMLLSLLAGDQGKCGDYASFRVNFSAVQEDTSTNPIVTLDFATSKSGLYLGGTYSTSLKHVIGGFPPSYTTIIPANSPPEPPAEQTVTGAALTNLLAHSVAGDPGYLVLALDVNDVLLDKTAPTGGTDFTDYFGDLTVIETLNFYEPNIEDPNAAVVPVPPSLILFGTGIMGLGFMAGWRRQS